MPINLDKCPVCKGNKVIGIPGETCKYCKGSGLFKMLLNHDEIHRAMEGDPHYNGVDEIFTSQAICRPAKDIGWNEVHCTYCWDLVTCKKCLAERVHYD